MKNSDLIVPTGFSKPVINADQMIRNKIEKSFGKGIKYWKDSKIERVVEKINYLYWCYREDITGLDYSDIYTQIAYLIAYYPNYIEGLSQILGLINQVELKKPNKSNDISPLYESWLRYFDHQERQPLNLAFLGSGPAPEMYGFKRFLNFFYRESFLLNHKNNFPKVSVDLFDSEKQWQWAIDNVTNKIIRNDEAETERKFQITFNPFDLTKPLSEMNFELKDEYHVVFLQNVLNEIPTPGVYFDKKANENNERKSNIFLENMKLFLERISPDVGYCIFATRGSQNYYLTSKIDEYLQEKKSYINILDNEKFSLATPSGRDERLKNYIYKDRLRWDYRSSENIANIFAVRKISS